MKDLSNWELLRIGYSLINYMEDAPTKMLVKKIVKELDSRNFEIQGDLKKYLSC